MAKLLNCKACGKEVAKGAKCPHCGKDQRIFFGKHKILTGFLVIIVIFIASSIGNKDNNTSTNVASNTDAKQEVKSTTPKVKTYSDGKYLVNKDIPSGIYKVTLKDNSIKMGYIERAKDLNMEVDSIIANIILTGNGYVEILNTDVAVKLQGVEIEPIKIQELKPEIKKEANDGIYLIGYDLSEGTYKVEVTDTTTKMGYVQRSRSVAMGTDDIIANEIVQGPSYVNIEKGDFAVRLQGVKITKQD